jgi:glycine/D-amino acid oxidase-like deaminating enzyme
VTDAPSWWWADLGGLPAPRPALDGDREADVCIVGAGYTGLWTAYELLRADPSLAVVVLEREVAGFGASGRNGGWVLGEVSTGLRQREAAGEAGVAALDRAIQATVDEVGAACTREGIDCDFVKGGSLSVAQTEPQLARLREGSRGVLLDVDEAAARVRVAGLRGARFTPHCARVQPAALARGLADAVERAGGRLYERSRVSRLAPGLASTAGGRVSARVVVRATEGYTARLPGLRRALVPLNSSMVVTEPLGEAAWEAIGWRNGETLHSGHHQFAYAQRTADGRIAIGGRGVPYRFGSRTDREGPVPEVTVRALRARLRGLFPVLADVGIADAWHGILGVSRTWQPAVGIDRARGVAWAGGYAGEGVAASNLAGRTLRDLILGEETELTRLPWVGPLARAWEPEPLRFVGVRLVHALFGVADRRERRSGRASVAARAAELLSGR